MVLKKSKVIVKNDSLNKKSTKKVESDELVENILIEESFKLVKNLNDKVSKVQKVKDRLQNDIKKLGTKLNKHESVANEKNSNKFYLNLKEEIVKEFTPLLNKFDLKGVKVDIFKEIAEIIEIETKKLHSEIISKTNSSKKLFNKKFSDIEVRIVDILSNNDKINKELKNFENKKIAKINAVLEEKVNFMVGTLEKKIYAKQVSNHKEIFNLKEEIETQKKDFKS